MNTVSHDERPPGADNMHRCPISGCEARIRWDLALCRQHWRHVPPDLAHQLYRAWRRGKGYGTTAHRVALDLVIEHVERVTAADTRIRQQRTLFDG